METHFSEQFKRLAQGESNSAMRRLRQDAFTRFVELGFPPVKSEDWKYTNVARIAKEAWATPTTPSDFSPAAGEKSEQILRAFNIDRNGFAALNLAFGEFHVIHIERANRETAGISQIEHGFGGHEGHKRILKKVT